VGAARGGGCVIAFVPAGGAEAAEGLTFSLTLASALTFVVSWGLLLGWNNTFGPLLEGLANALRINVWRVHVDPASKLRDLDHLVVGALQASIEASDLAMGYWFHQSARLQGWIGDEVWKLSRDTFHFGEFVVGTYGPLLLKAATTAVFPWPKLYRVIDSEIEKVLPKVGKIVKAPTLKDALEAAQIAALWTAVGAIAGALPHGGRIGSLPHGIGIPKSWTKWRSKVNTRLTKLEGIAAAGVFAGLMANVLRVPAKCLRSGNLGKSARHFCGLDSSWLNALLGLSVAVGGTISIVELAEATQKLVPGVIDGLGFLIDETPDAFRSIEHSVLQEAAALIPGL
jgi:hypothetical protein